MRSEKVKELIFHRKDSEKENRKTVRSLSVKSDFMLTGTSPTKIDRKNQFRGQRQ